MTWIPGTGVPLSVTVTCPKCKCLRLFQSTGPETIYRCSGCEWQYTFAAGTGGLSTNGAVTAGVSTALPFASGATIFSVGQVLFINDGASSEVVVVNGTVTGTSVPIADLDFNHNSGVGVTVAALAPTFANIQKIPQTAF